MPPQLDAIGIVVSELEPAVRFYRLLGVPFDDPGEAPHHEASLPSGLRVMLDTEELMRQIDPGWERPVGHRVVLAFVCDSPAEVDATFATVVAAGFTGHTAPWDAPWGQRYARVSDGDGNVVDLFAAS